MENFTKGAFQNKNFNKHDGESITNEKLQLEAFSASNSESDENYKSFKICLKNLPAYMKESDLSNLCKSFGRVTRVCIIYNKDANKSKMGFVDFTSVNKAELAIREINNNPDLGISAVFSKKRNKTPQGNNNNNSNNQNASSSSRKTNYSYNSVNENSRFQHLDPPKNNLGKPKSFVSDKDYKDPAIQNCDSTGKFNGKISLELLDSRNYKESREQVKMVQDSEGQYDAVKNIHRFKSNETVVYPKTGKCVFCGKLADKYCERCRDFYCSLQCQVDHWPIHRAICFAMPRLLSLSHDSMLRDDQQVQEMIQPKSPVQQGVPSNKPLQSPKIAEQVKNIPLGNQQQAINKNTKSLILHKLIPPRPTRSDTVTNSMPISKLNSVKITPILSTPSEKPKGNQTEFPKSNSVVTMTSFINSKRCYIRSCEPKLQTEYISVINAISKLSVNAPNLTECPKRGDFVLANFQETGFYRALVLNSDDPNQIKIAYLDFGNIDLQSYKQFKFAIEEIRSYKQFIHCVALKDINESDTNDSVVKFMNTLVDDSIDLKLVYSGEHNKQTECELIILQSNQSINKKIVDLWNIKKAVKEESTIVFSSLPQKGLTLGVNIPIYILDKSFIKDHVISCIDEAGLKELRELNVQIENYCKNNEAPSTVYTPNVNEVCLAKYNKEWYRGACAELKSDGNPSIHFIDFGNIAIVNIKDIRKIPKEFAQPILATDGFIFEINENYDDVYLDHLSKNLPDNEEIIADRIEMINNEYRVYLDTVLKEIENRN